MREIPKGACAAPAPQVLDRIVRMRGPGCRGIYMRASAVAACGLRRGGRALCACGRRRTSIHVSTGACRVPFLFIFWLAVCSTSYSHPGCG